MYNTWKGNAMTIHSTPHVLISGGGIAGHALALQLVRGSIRATVVERAAAPRPGGQAVDLRGASREVAERMGLMPGIRARLLHELGLSYVDGAGRVFGRMSMEDFDGKGAVAEIEIARGISNEVLLAALEATSEAAPGLLDLRYGDRITAIAQDADGVDVAFEHAPDERFDLVVGADGVHSATRRLAFGPEEQYSTLPRRVRRVLHDPDPRRRRAGLVLDAVRAGRDPRHPPDFDPSTSKAILTLRIDRDPALRGDRARTGGADPACPRRRRVARPRGARGHARGIRLLLRRARAHRRPRGANGRVALVGDAGSCGSPMSGMGTATALIGAYLLAARIAEAPGDPAAAGAALRERHRSVRRGRQEAHGRRHRAHGAGQPASRRRCRGR
jgi:2-polyprenyl-6-methoxyphenol hydroxylase-like FAD-dependent oxidoreductase